MVLWQWIIGIGLGVIATMLTARAIQYGHENNSQQYHPPQERRASNRKPCRKKYFQKPDDKCAICLETMNIHDIQYLLCGHAFHDACWKDMKSRDMDSKCPSCRVPLLVK